MPSNDMRDTPLDHAGGASPQPLPTHEQPGSLAEAIAANRARVAARQAEHAKRNAARVAEAKAEWTRQDMEAAAFCGYVKHMLGGALMTVEQAKAVIAAGVTEAQFVAMCRERLAADDVASQAR